VVRKVCKPLAILLLVFAVIHSNVTPTLNVSENPVPIVKKTDLA